MTSKTNLAFEQTFSATDTIVVTHNLANTYIEVRAIIGEVVRDDLVSSIVLSSLDPANSLTVSLASSQTGKIQIFARELLIAAMPTADEKAGLTVSNVSPSNPVATQTELATKADAIDGYLLLPEQATDPTILDQYGFLYSKDVSGTTELFYMDNYGVAVQVTAEGVSGQDGYNVKISANDTTPEFLDTKLVAGSNITLIENNDGGNETLTINASGGGLDGYNVKISANDTTPEFLDTKLVAGTNITLVENNDGGNETLTISATDATLADNYNVKISANDTTPDFLDTKLVAGTNVTFVENNDGGNETLTINASDATLADNYNVKVSSNDTTPDFLDTKLVAGQLISLTENNDGGNETLAVSVNEVAGKTLLDGYLPLAELGSDPTLIDQYGILYSKDDGSGTELFYMDNYGNTIQLTQDGNLSNLDGYNVKVSANDTTPEFLDTKLVAGTNVTIVENNDGGNETLTISASDATLADNYNVKISSNDTTPDFLDTKLVAGTNVTLVENNDGGNETLTINASDATLADNYNVKISSNDTTPNFLDTKLVAGTNITLVENNDGGNETLTISASDATLADNYNVKVSSDDTTPEFLDTKITAGAGIALTVNNGAGNEDLQIDFTGEIAGKTLLDGYLPLSEQASDATAADNYGMLYTKDDAGDTELFYIDNTGAITQLTKDGYLNAAEAIHQNLIGAGSNDHTAIDSHISDVTTNPHTVTLDKVYEAGRVITVDASSPVELNASGGAALELDGYVLLNEISDPTALGNIGSIYSKDVTGTTELFYIDSTGAVVQITSGGAVNASASGNTLDQAYDQGGAGAGRAITADSGPLSIDASGGASLEVDGYVSLIETSDPTLLANTGSLYSKDTDGYTELFYIDNNGTPTQVTKDGYLALTDNENIYYAGEHGDDGNSGLTWNEAFKTVGRATSVISATQTPSISNRFVIACLDAGTFQENVVLPPFVNLYAPNAALTVSSGVALTIEQGTANIELISLDGNNTTAVEQIGAAFCDVKVQFIVEGGAYTGTKGLVVGSTALLLARIGHSQADTEYEIASGGTLCAFYNQLFGARTNLGGTEKVTIAGADVSGPSSSVDNAVARFDSATGKIIQSSAVSINDDGYISTDGYVSLGELPVDPTALANTGSVYTKDDGSGTELFYIDNYGNIVQLTKDGNFGDITLARIGNSTYSTVQHLQDVFHSSGWVSGGTITEGIANTVNVSAGTGLIRATNDRTAEILYFDWAAETNLSVPSDDEQWVVVEYNSGSPQAVVRSTENTNMQTDFVIGYVYNEGGTLHIEQAEHAVGDHATNMIDRLYETMFIRRDEKGAGLIIGESADANRFITVTAGAFWHKLNRYAIGAIDTDTGGAADTFDVYYRDGVGGWTKVAAQSAWDNSSFDDNSGSLQPHTNNRHGVLWFYLELDGDLVCVYGQDEYTTIPLAQASVPPASLPPRLDEHGVLIGRLIYDELVTPADLVESTFTLTFDTSSVTDHGNLAGLTDDDHSIYHTDARGDTRYHTKTELNSTTSSSEGSLLIGTDSKTNLGGATTVEAALNSTDSHVGSTSNPHTVTMDQTYDGGSSITVDSGPVELLASGGAAIELDGYVLLNEISDPTALTNTGSVYSKDDGSGTELFYIDNYGNVTQITTDGALSAPPAHAGTHAFGGGDGVNHDSLINASGLTYNHAAIDAHIDDYANPHATDIANLGTGTLAELNGRVTDASLQRKTHISTVDPTGDNDSADSAGLGNTFDEGDYWVNTVEDQVFVCTASAINLAAWDRINNNGFLALEGLGGTQPTAGTPVYATGTQTENNVMDVAPARANASATMPCVGIAWPAAPSITSTIQGHVVTSGLIKGLDTSGFSLDDVLYVDAAAEGVLVNSPPTAASLAQAVATVVYVHATEGIILVHVKPWKSVPADLPSLTINSFWYGDASGNAVAVNFADNIDNKAIWTNGSNQLSGMTAKLTPISDDYMLIQDSVGGANKYITIGDLPSGGAGSDGYNVKVSTDDTTPDFLDAKLVAGTNITLTVNNPAGNETITIDAAGGGGGGLTDGRLPIPETTDPSPIDDYGILYSKDINTGFTELHYMDNYGEVTQITDDGYLGRAKQSGQIIVDCLYDQAGSMSPFDICALIDSSGDYPTVLIADNDILTSQRYLSLGIVLDRVDQTNPGRVCFGGLVEGIDTSTYAAGDYVFLGANGGIADEAEVTFTVNTAGSIVNASPIGRFVKIGNPGSILFYPTSPGSIHPFWDAPVQMFGNGQPTLNTDVTFNATPGAIWRDDTATMTSTANEPRLFYCRTSGDSAGRWTTLESPKWGASTSDVTKIESIGTGHIVGSSHINTSSLKHWICINETNAFGKWAQTNIVKPYAASIGINAQASHFWDKTTSPGTTDQNSGANQGSFWFDTTNDKVYACTASGESSSTWVDLTAADGYAIEQMFFVYVEPNNTDGTSNGRFRTITSGGAFDFPPFVLPFTPSAVYLWGFPIGSGGSATATFTINTNGGTDGEQNNNWTDAQGFTKDYSNEDQLFRWDVTTAFDEATSGDFVGWEIDHTATAVTAAYIGLEVVP